MLQAGFAPAIPASERPQAHTYIRPLKSRLRLIIVYLFCIWKKIAKVNYITKHLVIGEHTTASEICGCHDVPAFYSLWRDKRIVGRSQVTAVIGTALVSLPLQPHWPSGPRLYDPMSTERPLSLGKTVGRGKISSYCHTSLCVFKARCLNRRITFIVTLAGMHKTQYSSSSNTRKFYIVNRFSKYLSEHYVFRCHEASTVTSHVRRTDVYIRTGNARKEGKVDNSNKGPDRHHTYSAREDSAHLRYVTQRRI
jgi:hypothetical protein